MKKPIKIVLVVLLVLVGLAAVNFAPMLSKRVPGMEAIVHRGTTVHARPDDRQDARRVAERIADAAAGVREAFQATDTRPIDVILYPNQAALHRKTIGLVGVLLPDWYIGGNTPDSVLIVSPSRPGSAHTRESVEQAAVHEYVHVLTDRRNQALGYWLKEGIALYLAEQVPDASSVAAAADITWAEFSQPNALQFAQVGGYQLAHTLIEYIRDRHGWDAVLGLTEPEATHEAVLGQSRHELFDAWKAWLEETYGQQSA